MRILSVLIFAALTGCAGDNSSTSGVVGTSTSGGANDADIGEVIATVNGMKIGSEEFKQAASRTAAADGVELSKAERLEVMDTLIAEKILYQEALNKGLDKDPKVQKVMVNTLLREEVYAQVRNSDFTDEELKAYYEEHKDDFVVPAKVQIKRILIRVSDDRVDADAKKLADKVRGEIASNPKDMFKDAATKYSEDPYRRRGGDVGFVAKDGKPGLDQAVVDMAFGMEAQQLSDVFKTDDGYNIVFVANSRDRVERPFQQMKGSVLRKLKNEKLKGLYDGYVANLKTNAKVQIDEAKMEAVDVKAARKRPGAPNLDIPSLGQDGVAPPSPGDVGVPKMADDKPAANYVLSLLVASALVAPAHGVIVDRVAAVVNKQVITLSEVYDLGQGFIAESAVSEGVQGPLRRQAELEVLDVLIQRSLIRQEVDRLGMTVTREEIDRYIDQVARQNNFTREQLRQEVERSGAPWSIYRDETEEFIVQSKFNELVLMPRIAVSADEIADLYNRRVKTAYADPSRSLGAILLNWPADAAPEDRAALAVRAAQIKAAADAGTSWEQLLADNPDSVLAGAGGDMGTFSKGEAVAEVDGPAFTLPVGGVSDPIALPTGILVVRVMSETLPDAPPLASVKEDLTREIQARKMETELELWTVQARRQASVEILLEPPGVK